jgi:hypothetical protein
VERAAVDPECARGFFSVLEGVFGAGAAAGGAVERHFAAGGRAMVLRCATPEMLSVLEPALAPLACAPGDADVTFLAWDAATTGRPLPRAPWTADDLRPRGEVEGFATPAMMTAFVPGADAFCMYDAARRTGLFGIEDARDPHPYVRSNPLRYLLHWALGDDRFQLAHAGAVGTARGGVLLTGRGGSGKSTATLACLGSGLRIAGDDFVLVENGATPRVHGLYATARLAHDHLSRFPHLAARATRPPRDDGKALLLLDADALARSFPLRAVVLPRVVPGAATRLRPAGAAETLAALGATTLFLLPGAQRRAFAVLADVARRLPRHVLETGPDVTRIPAVLEELLACA